jgi:hypothetical protein
MSAKPYLDHQKKAKMTLNNIVPQTYMTSFGQPQTTQALSHRGQIN